MNGFITYIYKTTSEEAVSLNRTTPYQRKELKSIFSAEAPQLWLFVQFMFYTLVRPKELRFVQVADLQGDTLLIRGTIAKNSKTEHVVIPPKLKKVIAEAGLTSYPPTFYLFGKEGRPSVKHWGTNHFYRKHQAFLQRLGYSDQYSLYSWKHTGVIISYQKNIKIVDISRQCRHGDLVQTTTYLRSLGLSDSGYNQAEDIEL